MTQPDAVGRLEQHQVTGLKLRLQELVGLFRRLREHMAVGTQVVRLNISRLVVVGREARSLYVSAVNEGSWGNECVFAETPEEAYQLLQAELEPGDLVLFKSSNSIGLRHLGDRIALPPQAPGTAAVSAKGQAAENAAGDTAGTGTEGSALL